MNARPQTPRTRAKSAVALLLTFAAGVVDIVAFLLVYHVFVAHMTGATVHLGNDLVAGNWAAVTRGGVTVASFVFGSIVGRSIIEAAVRKHKRAAASATLAMEAALILAFIGVWRMLLSPAKAQEIPLRAACLLLALLAGAMGLQTATLTRIGPLTIHTTFVTGMLNKFAQLVSQWLFWVHDQWRKKVGLGEIFQGARRHLAYRNARFMSAIWVAYVAGSVAGTWMNARWNAGALYVPALILLVSVGVDQFWPLSVEEEQDQA